MLDAKIAEHTTVKAARSTEIMKRAKSGRVPFDYRVVDFAKKVPRSRRPEEYNRGYVNGVTSVADTGYTRITAARR